MKFILLILILLASCDSGGVQEYRIKKIKPESAKAVLEPPIDSSQTPVVLPTMHSPLPKKLVWQKPEHWQDGPSSSIRMANFVISKTGGTAECYVTVLPGNAGGTLANVNRWRSQMSLPPITAGELEEHVQKKQLAGQEAIFMALQGKYIGLGPIKQVNSQMLIMAAFYDQGSIFVKMVGPKSIVSEEITAFHQFCQSIAIQ